MINHYQALLKPYWSMCLWVKCSQNHDHSCNCWDEPSMITWAGHDPGLHISPRSASHGPTPPLHPDAAGWHFERPSLCPAMASLANSALQRQVYRTKAMALEDTTRMSSTSPGRGHHGWSHAMVKLPEFPPWVEPWWVGVERCRWVFFGHFWMIVF